MTEHLSVEVVRADQVQEGQEVVIVEFRGKVAVVDGFKNFGEKSVWVGLEGGEGAELRKDCPVLRVLSGEPSEAERDAMALAARHALDNVEALTDFSERGSTETCYEVVDAVLAAARKARSGDA